MSPLGIALAVMAILGSTRVAAAAEAKTELTASLLAAYGAGGRFEDGSLNRYGYALGGRAGVILRAPRVYLGVSFIRFLGDEDASGKYYTSTLDLEVGYDFRLLDDILVIRPGLALGVAQPVTIQSDNAGYPLTFHWAPALLVGVRLLPLFVSAEVRRDIASDEWSRATTFALGAGVVF